MHAGTIVLACLACACDARRVQTELGFSPNPIGSIQPRVATTAVGPKMAGPKDIGSTKSIGQMLSGVASGSSVPTETRIEPRVAAAPKPGAFYAAENPSSFYSIGPPSQSKIASTNTGGKIATEEVLKGTEARPLPLDTIAAWRAPTTIFTQAQTVPRAANGPTKKRVTAGPKMAAPKDIGSTKSIGQMLSGVASGSSVPTETRIEPRVAAAPKPGALYAAENPSSFYSIGPPSQSIVSTNTGHKIVTEEVLKETQARPLPLDTIAGWTAPTTIFTQAQTVPRAAVGTKSIGAFSSDTPPSRTLSTTSGKSISEDEVLQCQAAWAGAIEHISKVHADGGDYVKAAAAAAGELYGYGHSNVLFKPTKAASHPFRPDASEAMSYFVGCDAVDGGYEEDGGFAINGGKGWSHVKFDNHQIQLNADTAVAMGTYYFTCASTKVVSKVEYTFGYKRKDDGKVRIFLHHSSVPYTAQDAAASPPVTKEEVLAVQKAWSTAIKQISKTHKEGGDYIQAAADAAGELYAYGHSSVLFKPTKAAEYQFRPTAEEAMSYFVGGNVVDGGYAEDAGFAINGGKGWADCVYDNHQVELTGGIGMAMGNYDFTCATTGDTTKVEYTFGYKRCEDGKVRIFLHHSSIPYMA